MSKEHCVPESASEPIRLMKQVKDCISEIYTEHINDLEQRKKKRLDCRVPTDFFHPYNLVVNWPFQQRIRLQIQAVIKFQLGESLKESVIASMNEFIDYLREFVKKFDDKKAFLRAIIIFEAYHTLQNSISQVGSIVSELISKYAFDIISKRAFCEKIANNYLELIDEIGKKENSQYAVDLGKMKLELEGLTGAPEDERNTRFEYASTIYSDSCSDNEESSVEPLHSMPIDELVRLLSQEKTMVRRRKNRRKKRTCKSGAHENGVGELDQEIRDFEEKLNLHKNCENKAKPQVSKDFISSLKEQINMLRNTHS